MKYLLILLDGIGDFPSDVLGGKTPLEAARTPNADYFAKIGRVGLVRTIPDRKEAVPYVAVPSIFGYDPRQYEIGQGPLEAADLELKLEENEVAFRANLVTEAGGRLADPTAGHITTREAKALINFLNKKLASDFVRFFAGREHRHIAVIKDSRGLKALSAAVPPPAQIVGKPIEHHLPKGPGEDLIKKLMYDAKLLLESHEINQVRVDLGENPANMVWLWSQGVMPKLPKFSERFDGLSGATVSTMELMKGFSRLIGLTVMEVAPRSIYPDFDYEGKAEMMLELLKEKDFVCAHVRSCDEAAQAGNLKQKVVSIEAIDHHILGAAKKFYETERDARALITSLLTTPWQLRHYVRDSVPMIISGKNVTPDEIEHFSEATAQVSALRFQEGWKLMEYFLSAKEELARV